jgi:hypothetical protein
MKDVSSKVDKTILFFCDILGRENTRSKACFHLTTTTTECWLQDFSRWRRIAFKIKQLEMFGTIRGRGTARRIPKSHLQLAQSYLESV